MRINRIVIVTTYPKSGSKNIGDQLITDCLKEIIEDNCSKVEFDIVFRADPWGEVSDIVLRADHVFFACLAIRKNMDSVEYPWLSKLIENKVPFSAIASGTDLPVNINKDIYSDFSEGALKLLEDVNLAATAFTTRGLASQFFCDSQGLSNSSFNGDIAFYDKRYNGLRFKKNRVIKNIVISDPHKSRAYFNSIQVLIKGLRSIFPEASLVLAQHGESKRFESFCISNGIDLVKIYENKKSGLDIYDNADLHVGYRVHGHVSALKRRKYSYLLEQDGRGCDYGLTINRKISIPSYLNGLAVSKPKKALEKIFYKFVGEPVASVAPAHQLLAMISCDAKDGFSRFLGLECQIEQFNSSADYTIKNILKKI